MAPIELSPEERRKTIIKNCGAQYLGERPSAQDPAQLISYFNDPLTNSTLTLRTEEVTVYNVRNKLHESRARFGIPIIESSLLGHLELVSQFKLFISSLERTKNLPDQVMTAAANAAVMEIVSFESVNAEMENAAQV